MKKGTEECEQLHGKRKIFKVKVSTNVEKPFQHVTQHFNNVYICLVS